jgi:hypothetical protein
VSYDLRVYAPDALGAAELRELVAGVSQLAVSVSKSSFLVDVPGGCAGPSRCARRGTRVGSAAGVARHPSGRSCHLIGQRVVKVAGPCWTGGCAGGCGVERSGAGRVGADGPGGGQPLLPPESLRREHFRASGLGTTRTQAHWPAGSRTMWRSGTGCTSNTSTARFPGDEQDVAHDACQARDQTRRTRHW